MSYTHIHPADFVELLERWTDEDGWIVDVREPFEWEYFHLDGSTHIPMNTIPDRLAELPEDRPLYIICAHGVRSEAVSQYLAHNGFSSVINVLGGMAAVSGLLGFQYD